MADVAWSPIQHEGGLIKVGETVSRDKLKGVDKEEYDALKKSGAIRSKPYPKDIGADESPREYRIRQVNDAVRKAEDHAYDDLDDVLFDESELVPDVEEESASKSG